MVTMGRVLPKHIANHGPHVKTGMIGHMDLPSSNFTMENMGIKTILHMIKDDGKLKGTPRAMHRKIRREEMQEDKEKVK